MEYSVSIAILWQSMFASSIKCSQILAYLSVQSHVNRGLEQGSKSVFPLAISSIFLKELGIAPFSSYVYTLFYIYKNVYKKHEGEISQKLRNI